MDGGGLAERVGHHPEHLAVLGEMLGEHSSLVQQLRHFLAQDRGHTFDLLVAVIKNLKLKRCITGTVCKKKKKKKIFGRPKKVKSDNYNRQTFAKFF
jgi:hypothetical protein